MNSMQLIKAAIALANQQRTTSDAAPADADADDALRQYWADSQCRLQRWQENIHHFDIEIRNAPEFAMISGLGHLEALEELLFVDVLTTVFTALMASNVADENDQNPIGQSVFEANRQARSRTIGLLEYVFHRNSRLRKQEPAILQVYRGRHRAELWTDILLAYLPISEELSESFGFEAKRIGQLRANIASLEQQEKLNAFTGKLSSDLESYFRQYPPQPSGNEELNRQILDSMHAALGCKPSAIPSLAGRSV